MGLAGLEMSTTKKVFGPVTYAYLPETATSSIEVAERRPSVALPTSTGLVGFGMSTTVKIGPAAETT